MRGHVRVHPMEHGICRYKLVLIDILRGLVRDHAITTYEAFAIRKTSINVLNITITWVPRIRPIVGIRTVVLISI